MIRLSERDDLEEYLYGKLSESASLDDIWGEFARDLNRRISDNFDEYVDSEYKKSDIPSKKKKLEDEWDALKDRNAMTPEKETELSDKLAELDDEEDNFKYAIKEKLNYLHHKIWKRFLEERI